MSKERKLEAYLSDVRHDLRNHLVILHEGIRQALDGLGNKDCNKCFDILRPVLESADKMNKLIEKRINISAFKRILKKKIYKKS